MATLAVGHAARQPRVQSHAGPAPRAAPSTRGVAAVARPKAPTPDSAAPRQPARDGADAGASAPASVRDQQRARAAGVAPSGAGGGSGVRTGGLVGPRAGARVARGNHDALGKGLARYNGPGSRQVGTGGTATDRMAASVTAAGRHVPLFGGSRAPAVHTTDASMHASAAVLTVVRSNDECTYPYPPHAPCACTQPRTSF